MLTFGRERRPLVKCKPNNVWENQKIRVEMNRWSGYVLSADIFTSALHKVAYEGQFGVFKLLFESLMPLKMFKFGAVDTDADFSLLHCASAGSLRITRFDGGGCGHVDIIKYLLEMRKTYPDIDVNAPDKYGYTPLRHLCIHPKGNRTAKLFLECGADPNVQDIYGATGLHEALNTRNDQMVKMLLAHGADPRIKDVDGCSSMDSIIHAKELKALMRLQVRKLNGEDVSTMDGHKYCTVCKRRERAMKVCSRCRVPFYCSAECQKKHWKVHKKTCSKESSTIYKLQHAGGQLVDMERLMNSCYEKKPGGLGSNAPDKRRLYRGKRSIEDPLANGKKAKKFIVKIQVPMDGWGGKPWEQDKLACAVYNKSRKFNGMIFKNDQPEAYLELVENIKENGDAGAYGMRGLKSYFYARFDEKNRFRVFTCEHLPQQTW